MSLTRQSFLPAVAMNLSLTGLAVATTAMGALHVLQPELDPVAQPVSFYVWGPHGWLLPVALGAFGLALLALMSGLVVAAPSWPRRILALVGTGLLLTACVPSDRWFPWEHTPSLSGLVHAAAAMLAPALLVYPMVALQPRRPRLRTVLHWIVGFYMASVVASAGSLGLGLWLAGPPPWIGLFERTLAVAALGWTSIFAWPARGK